MLGAVGSRVVLIFNQKVVRSDLNGGWLAFNLKDQTGDNPQKFVSVCPADFDGRRTGF